MHSRFAASLTFVALSVPGRLVCYASHHRCAFFCDGECAVRQTSDSGVSVASWTEGMTSRSGYNCLFETKFSWLHSVIVIDFSGLIVWFLSTQMSVMHLLVRRHPSNTEPIKSKEELVFHCGFRRFRASPIFSQHTSGRNRLKTKHAPKCTSYLNHLIHA